MIGKIIDRENMAGASKNRHIIPVINLPLRIFDTINDHN